MVVAKKCTHGFYSTMQGYINAYMHALHYSCGMMQCINRGRRWREQLHSWERLDTLSTYRRCIPWKDLQPYRDGWLRRVLAPLHTSLYHSGRIKDGGMDEDMPDGWVGGWMGFQLKHNCWCNKLLSILRVLWLKLWLWVIIYEEGEEQNMEGRGWLQST
jgi:hypothetical protein